jgi:filamentous hemagglutinin
LAAGSDNVYISPLTGNVVVNTWINGVLDPVQSDDAANKYYVDNAVSAGLDIHEPAVADADSDVGATYVNGGTTPTWTTILAGNVIATGSAHGLVVNDVIVFGSTTNGITAGTPYFVLSTPTTTEITLTLKYNGDIPVALTAGTGLSITSLANAGVGATLTSTTNGPFVSELYTGALNDRILILGQNNAWENGIYYISQVGVAGGGGSPWIMTRATDGNKFGENSATTLGQGAYFLVTGGDDAGEAYVLNTVGTIVFGTTNLTFAQFSQTLAYTANTQAGLSLTGTVFSALVDNNTTAFDGQGNIIVKASANLTTPNIGAATGTSLSVTGTVTADTAVNTSGTMSATGTATVGNLATGGTVSATGDVLTSGNVSATGNVTGGNLTTVGDVTATGNVTGQYYFGNGFYMSGVANASSAGNLVNGNSNVTIPIIDGNVLIGIGGTPNVAVFATTGEYVTGLLSVTGDITGANINASGYVSATGDVTGGNLNTGGAVTATGTVTGGNVQTGGYVSATGDITGADLYTGGQVSATGTVTGGNVQTGGYVSATGDITGADLYTGGQVSATGTVTGGNVVTAGYVSATGDITGANVSATGIVYGSEILTTGSGGDISGSGNITGGNINTSGQVTAIGDVTGGNLVTGGLVTAVGDVTGGNFYTGGDVSATGTVTGGNVVTGGIVSASGTVTGGNVQTAGQVSATGDVLTSGNVSATGNVIGGNITTTGLMSASGNVYANYFIGNIQGNLAAPGANTDVIFNDSGEASATDGFTFDKTSNTVTVTGTINGGNLATSGTASATGDVTGGNFYTGGVVSATGDITGANLYTSGVVSATANITGANVSATGNVIGNVLITALGGIDSYTGNIALNYSGELVNTSILDGNGNVVFFVDATTSTASFGNATQKVGSLVSFNAPTAITLPVGNTGQRPGTASTGQFRFNTTTNSLEVYDNTSWTPVGVPAFTLITDQQFNGDGTTVTYTLSANATTAGTIVSINGVQQIPITAYAVSGTTLTFTEAPDVADLIDVRVLTTTTSVTSISNLSGNAVVSVSDTSATTTVTGDLTVTGNVNIGGNVATNQINNGSSAVQIPIANGNIDVKVNGANVTVWTTQGEYVTGNVSVTGDVIAQNVNSLSDATLKENVTPITDAGQVVDALEGVGYDWKDGSGHAYGMIAQAVEEIIPEAVKTDENGIKSINYSMVIPFLVETVKELRQDIAEIKAQLKK